MPSFSGKVVSKIDKTFSPGNSCLQIEWKISTLKYDKKQSEDRIQNRIVDIIEWNTIVIKKETLYMGTSSLLWNILVHKAMR